MMAPATEAYLRQRAATTAVATLARHVGWHPSSVYRALGRLGCRRRTVAYAAADLASACGCRTAVVTHWIATGALHAVRRRTTGDRRGTRYTLTDEAIGAFLTTEFKLWRKFSVPKPDWARVNRQYEPGSAAWHRALAPWPLPGQIWLQSFIEDAL